ALEVAEVHRMGVRPERPDRHRVSRRRAAELADAHVDRHLPALETGAHLVRARARLLALDPARRVAALAGARPAAYALAILPRLGGLEVREVQLLFRHYAFSSTFTRWRTLRSMPSRTGPVSCSTERPILPSPSARSVPRWRSLWPIWLRTW